MTKDEIKNRISIALKDPVLQQGFEIICKENAKLKGEVDEQLAEAQKRIEELEQQVEKMMCCENCKNFGEYFVCVKLDGTNRTIAQKKVKGCRFPEQCKNKELWEMKIQQSPGIKPG